MSHETPSVTLTMSAADASNESLEQAEVVLSSDDLEKIVNEWFARKVGMALPVTGELVWFWTPGRGPVAAVTIRPAGENVLPLRPRAAR